ncbi:high-affinity nickel-transport family protein [Candidatus Binatus sp.]|uniref:high-affinity nickel-transport family protein n=1 Tax=Candidatus Binatus sp. TaxID=2811406 RepID=UPI003CC6A2E0
MNFETTAPLGIALLGLLIGMRHATDPDHVIAVTSIVSRERRLTAAGRVGIVWGLGHTLTVLAVGAAIIIFKIAIPIRLGLAMEFAVAIVLILLGLGAFASLVQLVVRRITGTPFTFDQPLVVHSHAHGHGFGPHRHSHVHPDPDEYHGSEQLALNHEHSLPAGALSSFAIRRPLLRSFVVGLVHGLAGSAAIALLVLSAIPQPLWATLYLAIFCLGTILGMGLITTAIATPFAVAAQRMSWMHQGLITGSGLLSFGFGLFLAYQLGIVDHLFGTAPIWIPH